MNLKEFDTLQNKYKKLKLYYEKNKILLYQISDILSNIHTLICDKNMNKASSEDIQNEVRKAERKLSDLFSSVTDKDVRVLIEKEVVRLESIDLASKPLTLEVRNNDE